MLLANSADPHPRKKIVVREVNWEGKNVFKKPAIGALIELKVTVQQK